MPLRHKLSLMLLAATLIAAAPACAQAEDSNPDAQSIGAMMKLLKLDELLNKEPQPLKHSKVGDENNTAPTAPQQPQVSAPTPPDIQKPATTHPVVASTNSQPAQAEPKSTMPRPVNPAATGTPAKSKKGVNVAKPGKLADNTKTGGSSGGVQNAMPSFGDVVNKPKPKSKIKQVSPAKPVYPKSKQDEDIDGDGVIEGDNENPAPR